MAVLERCAETSTAPQGALSGSLSLADKLAKQAASAGGGDAEGAGHEVDPKTPLMPVAAETGHGTDCLNVAWQMPEAVEGAAAIEAPAEFEVQYGHRRALTWKTVAMVTGGPSGHCGSCTIDGLKPATPYMVRVRARFGAAEWGQHSASYVTATLGAHDHAGQAVDQAAVEASRLALAEPLEAAIADDETPTTGDMVQSLLGSIKAHNGLLVAEVIECLQVSGQSPSRCRCASLRQPVNQPLVCHRASSAVGRRW